ncbi:MAG TPA: tetratricopeptide repeat protein [candidate division Zixibacteria bacterium]|nr:tetratricopeptide repeat protein [candidate division Zixibacteria bacterium]
MPRYLLAAVVVLFTCAVVFCQVESAAYHPQQTESSGQSMTLAPPAPDLSSLSLQELEERGDILRARKDYLDALDYYNAALKRQPSALLYNKVAMVHIMMGLYPDARKELKKALKLRKDYADAYNNTAVTFYKQKRYGAAIKDFKKAISIDPQNATYHSSLGTVYMDNKQFDLAMAEYRHALSLDPEVFDHNSPFGVSAALRSPEDQARHAYEMAKLYASIGDFERALRYLRKAMEEGYPEIRNVYKEKSFASLREDERFVSLMKQRPVAIPQQ